MRAYEVRSLALGAETEVFKLHHRYDRIIVISLDEIDILRREAGHRPQFTAIELPAAAYLHWIFRKGVMPLDCRQDANAWQIERLGDIFAAHDKGLGARAWHHAIEEMYRIGNRPRRHVFIERQLLLHHRVRNRQGIVALRDAYLGKIFPLDAVAVHVVLRD